MIQVEQTFLDQSEIPIVWRVTQGNDADIDVVVDWLSERKQAVSELLDRHGGVLLRGFTAINSAERFEKALDVLAPELMDYIGGTAPRSTVRGRILTSTDLPQNYTLALHQEMAYTANPPDNIAFFCEVAPTEGGETTVADARIVTRQIDPEVRARFERRGVGVRRTLPTEASVNKKPGIPKAWTDVFDTKDPKVVERIALEKGWKVDWLPDSSLQLWQELLPGFKTHPRTGVRVWFNQVHYHAPECTLLWALRDGRQDQVAEIKRAMLDHPEMLDYVFHRDGSRVAAEDAEHIWDVLVQSEIPMRWQACDLLLLDNVLAMHGRRAFRGNRRILAALIRNRAGAKSSPEPAHADA